MQAGSENLLDATAANSSGVLLLSAIHSYYAEKLAQKTACFSYGGQTQNSKDATYCSGFNSDTDYFLRH